jgi:hypothetical protein
LDGAAARKPRSHIKSHIKTIRGDRERHLTGLPLAL